MVRELNLSLLYPNIVDSPGRHVALGSIWVTVSSVLATYHITKAVDANGVFIEPSGLYTSGLIR